MVWYEGGSSAGSNSRPVEHPQLGLAAELRRARHIVIRLLSGAVSHCPMALTGLIKGGKRSVQNLRTVPPLLYDRNR